MVSQRISIKRVICMLLVLALVVSNLSIIENNTALAATNDVVMVTTPISVDGLEYEITVKDNNLEATLVGPKNLSGDIVIPEKISSNGIDIPVTKIKEELFTANQNITSLTMPDTVTEVGIHAFAVCLNLKSLVLSNNLDPSTFDSNSIQACFSLEKVNIPASFETIPGLLFAGIVTIKELTIPSSIKSIDRDIFSSSNFRNLESVIYLGTEEQWNTLINENCVEGNDALKAENLKITFVCNHDYEAVSNGDNTHSIICSECGDVKVDSEACSGGAATCKDLAVCEICGEEYGELAKCDPNNYEIISNGDDTHSIICSLCGDVKLDSEACFGGAATCIKRAVCEICGEEYGDYAKHQINGVDGACSVCGTKRSQVKSIGVSYLENITAGMEPIYDIIVWGDTEDEIDPIEDYSYEWQSLSLGAFTTEPTYLKILVTLAEGYTVGETTEIRIGDNYDIDCTDKEFGYSLTETEDGRIQVEIRTVSIKPTKGKCYFNAMDYSELVDGAKYVVEKDEYGYPVIVRNDLAENNYFTYDLAEALITVTGKVNITGEYCGIYVEGTVTITGSEGSEFSIDTVLEGTPVSIGGGAVLILDGDLDFKVKGPGAIYSDFYNGRTAYLVALESYTGDIYLESSGSEDAPAINGVDIAILNAGDVTIKNGQMVPAVHNVYSFSANVNSLYINSFVNIYGSTYIKAKEDVMIESISSNSFFASTYIEANNIVYNADGCAAIVSASDSDNSLVLKAKNNIDITSKNFVRTPAIVVYGTMIADCKNFTCNIEDMAFGIIASIEFTVNATDTITFNYNIPYLIESEKATMSGKNIVLNETGDHRNVFWEVGELSLNGEFIYNANHVWIIDGSDHFICSECGKVIDKPYIEIPTLESVQLDAQIDGIGAGHAVYTWTSSNEKVATVDETGKVTAHTYGKVIITATAEDGRSVKCEVQTRFYDVAGSNVKGSANYQYYYDPVYWAADNGITTGYNGVYFGPERLCTRQELLIFLWRVAGQPKAKGDARKYFSDVTAGTNTATNKSIAWAYENGITKGYTEGGKSLFKPTQSVTRQETMIFLWRVAGQPTAKGSLTFTDCKNLNKDSATYKAILWGSNVGITGGYSDGTFGLTKDCLREAIVTFLYRFNKLS